MTERLAIFLLGILVLWPAVLGQSRSATADLAGIVRDQTSAVLPGVTVTVESLATGLERTTVSSDDGAYRVLALRPGFYSVTASLAGFKTRSYERIQLTVGQVADLDIELELEQAQFSVEVTEQANIVEREKTVQSSTIGSEQIANLPINGREFLDFALLTPGATTTNALDKAQPINTPTTGLSFAGQDGRSNYITVDGVDAMDVSVATGRPALSQEAVQEFQISRSTFAADAGRSRGGIVNVVSKSGGRDFHGNAFFFLRNEALDARNVFAPSGDKPRFERYQWGATLGGPLGDNTFFFGSYEGQARRESVLVTFLDNPDIFRLTDSQDELFSFLGGTGDPGLAQLASLFADPSTGLLNTTPQTFPQTVNLFESESGVFPFSGDRTLLSFKLDHYFSSNNQFFALVTFNDSQEDNSQFGALDGVSHGVSVDSRNYSIALSDTHVFSPNTLNDFKFQHTFRRFEVPTNSELGPEVVIAGVATLGRDFTNPTGYDLTGFQFADHFTHVRGRHTLKLGADLNRVNTDGFAEVFIGGQFLFGEVIPLAGILDAVVGTGAAEDLIGLLGGPLNRPDLIENVLTPVASLQAFNFGLPVTYFQGFGDASSNYNFYQLGLYAQDDWRVSDNFVFNLGLRYDVEWVTDAPTVQGSFPPFTIGMEAPSDKNNFAPRLGFAWDPFDTGKTVIRGGYGLYYQTLFQALSFTARVLGGQIRQVFLPITGIPGAAGDSVQVWNLLQQEGVITEDNLASIGVVPGATPGVIFPWTQGVVNPYSQQASLEIEQELSRDLSLSVGYLLNRGLHIVRLRDLNVNRVGPDQFVLPGLDPRFLQINAIETSASSHYHGLTATLRKRLADRWSAFVSYTLGRAIDDVTDFTVPVEPHNHSNLRAQRGLSTFDQRHRLTANAIFQTHPDAPGTGFWNRFSADWTIAPIVAWGSGRPFNLLTGFDANGDGHAESDRPRLANGDLVGRNTGSGPSFFSTDVRLTRSFQVGEEARIEALIEFFNLFDNVNYSGVNEVVGGARLSNSRVEGSADIAPSQPLGFTSAFNPRQLQFGIRFVF